MNQNDKLISIGQKVLEFRKENGFSKKLSIELQKEVAAICNTGITAYAIEKAIGIQRNTITEWAKKHQPEPRFSEVNVVDESNGKAMLEIKLSTIIQGCRLELIGSDYSLLQRLLRKLS